MGKVEDVADGVLRAVRPYLKPVAHVCMLSTFVEDGFRMIFQFQDQANYMNNFWRCGAFLAHTFVLFNLVVQLGSAGCILFRFRTQTAIFALMSVVLLQSLAYHALWDMHFFLKNLSVFGGLLLLLAETMDTGKASLFAGLPESGPRDRSSGLQFAGRLLTVLMFLTLVKLDSPVRIFVDVLGLVLVSLVCIGLYTKVSALAVVLLLLLENLTLNAFWMETSPAMRDFRKYDFFQTVSVIGGQLLLVALGPGGLSVDEHKKKW